MGQGECGRGLIAKTPGGGKLQVVTRI
jgi:hypothetical protein